MKKAIVILLISVLFMLAGCVEKKSVNNEERDYIVYNMEKVPSDLGMLENDNIREQDLSLCLFEGLVSKNEKDEIIPSLASNFKVSEDKLAYTFKLRDNAKWSDGTYITAQDFQKFFSQVLKKENNIYKNQLYCVFGAKDYAEGKNDFSGVAIIARNEKTLEIRLNYPCDYFLSILSQPIYGLKRDFDYLKNWKVQYSKIVYSGPYKIDKVNNKNEILLVKNNMYWDKSSVKSSEIYIKNEEAKAFALAHYKWNEVDIITNPPIKNSDNNIERGEISSGISKSGVNLNFNFKGQDAIKDLNFRKAINYAINREEILSLTKGEEAKMYIPKSILKKDNKESDSLFSKYNNIQKAKGFLNKSKYNGEKITLIYFSDIYNSEKIVQKIKKELKEVNINIIIKKMNKKNLKELKNESYDILLTDYNLEYDSELAFFEKWVSDSQFNIYGYKNLTYDGLILKMKMSYDDSKNCYNEIKNLLYNDMPCIPLYFKSYVICKKGYINGLKINKRGNIILKEAYIEKLPCI